MERVLFLLGRYQSVIVIWGSLAAFFVIGIAFDLFGHDDRSGQKLDFLNPARCAQFASLFAPVVHWKWFFHGARRGLKWVAILLTPCLLTGLLKILLK